jgi:hypothetical protein
VETGLILTVRLKSFVDVLSAHKGVIWLILATVAEATPVVGPIGFLAPHF